MSDEKLPIGQGHGTAGRYAGLPDEYASEESAKVVILPVPFDKTTTYRKGSDKGPEALIEASRNLELYDIETDSEPFLNGIYTAPAIRANNSKDMLINTYVAIKKYLEKGKLPIVIGGEHSISFAPIRAYAEHYQKLTILQLDAHADLQQTYENNPWSHACVMARVKELKGIDRIVSVGIRSMSSEEKPFLDTEATFFAHDIKDDPQWMDKVLEVLSGPIYITFDLDFFDCSLMPSTGTPEPGGLMWNPTLKFLKKVFQERNIVGFDLVELCPNFYNPAPDYLAAKLIYKLLSYYFSTRSMS